MIEPTLDKGAAAEEACPLNPFCDAALRVEAARLAAHVHHDSHGTMVELTREIYAFLSGGPDAIQDPRSDTASFEDRPPTGHQPKPPNKVTPEQIQALKDRVIYHTAPRIGNLTSTFVHAYLYGEFYLASGYSDCVDPDNFNAAMGEDIARKNAEHAVNQKLWEMESYALWKKLR